MFNPIVVALFVSLVAAARDNPFNAQTSKGTFGPFKAVRNPARSATGGPTSLTANQAQQLQTACDNWTKDTGIVSNFQDKGKGTNGQAFNSLANGAYVAEVDELTHKAILDGIIGNDPTVSIANLTLTNGVFQSVVDNLQIMSLQGKTRVNLIDYINSVRCVQIMPSIDAYCSQAAALIGPTGIVRKAVRPAACAGITAADQTTSDYPNVPGTPGYTPQAGAGAGPTKTTGGKGATPVSSAPATATTSKAAGGRGGPLTQLTNLIPGIPQFTGLPNFGSFFTKNNKEKRWHPRLFQV